GFRKPRNGFYGVFRVFEAFFCFFRDQNL
ncbi:hypothetical protein MPH_14248, partial [Macrophomina phaseolina MS6]